ncbi:MAG: alpha/beta fold hydrolase, partial [Alphaproteobacteria bacterium]|nr:alpha/beta fold hydrolase [Alphaproteobacteria bacterium]
MHPPQPRMNWAPALGLGIAAVWVGTLGACVPRELAPGPDADQPIPVQLAPAELITGDGYVLPVRSWLPESGDGAMAPKAVVVALHGFNDYSNAFAGPGAWLAERGIAVYAFDQRGFGATADRGMWPGTETMIDDLRAMIARLRSQYADVPLYGLGESMGGAVMLTGWAQEPFDLDGIILAGPAVWGRAGMPGYMQTGLWIFAHTLPWLRLSPENLDYIPSDNIEMLRALGRDPLVIKETRVDAM